MKFGHVVFETREPTDRQTYGHKNSSTSHATWKFGKRFRNCSEGLKPRLPVPPLHSRLPKAVYA